VLSPFDVLFEADSLTDYALPADLKHLYGPLGFSTPVVYSNFVSSVDGVVTLGSKPSAGSIISGKYPADRFLMGLLRACADAVMVGAGTLRATPGHLWTPAHVYPELGTEFIALRSALGRSAEPALVVLTASGELDFKHPALVRGATVVTTAAGEKKIGGRLPAACELVTMGTLNAPRVARPGRPLRRASPATSPASGEDKSLNMRAVIHELNGRGHEVLLTEGGPHVVGQLIEGHLLDEAFLTISPVVAGRGEEKRLGMVEGVELLPGKGAWNKLLSARRHGDYLFLRYGFKKT